MNKLLKHPYFEDLAKIIDDGINVTEAVISRSIELISQGYIVCFIYDRGKNLRIHMAKGCVSLNRYLSLDVIRQARTDSILYVLEELADALADF